MVQEQREALLTATACGPVQGREAVAIGSQMAAKAEVATTSKVPRPSLVAAA